MLIPDIITILVVSVAVVAIAATAAVLGSVLVVVLVAAVYFIVIIKFVLLLTVLIDWALKINFIPSSDSLPRTGGWLAWGHVTSLFHIDNCACGPSSLPSAGCYSARCVYRGCHGKQTQLAETERLGCSMNCCNVQKQTDTIFAWLVRLQTYSVFLFCPLKQDSD